MDRAVVGGVVEVVNSNLAQAYKYFSTVTDKTDSVSSLSLSPSISLSLSLSLFNIGDLQYSVKEYKENKYTMGHVRQMNTHNNPKMS